VTETIWIIISRWLVGKKQKQNFFIKFGKNVNERCEMMSEADERDVVKT